MNPRRLNFDETDLVGVQSAFYPWPSPALVCFACFVVATCRSFRHHLPVTGESTWPKGVFLSAS